MSQHNTKLYVCSFGCSLYELRRRQLQPHHFSVPQFPIILHPRQVVVTDLCVRARACARACARVCRRAGVRACVWAIPGVITQGKARPGKACTHVTYYLRVLRGATRIASEGRQLVVLAPENPLLGLHELLICVCVCVCISGGATVFRDCAYPPFYPGTHSNNVCIHS